MSFTPDTLSVIVQPIGGDGIRFVSYRTDDPVDTVTGAGYFVGARKFGIRDHDLVFVSPEAGAEEPYILVIDIDSNGNGTGDLGRADTAMQPTVYDPQGKAADAFDPANHSGAVWDSGTTRTMKARARDVYCILDAPGSADPTGDNLSTASLQAMLAEANANRGIKLDIMYGTYRVDQMLELLAPATIVGRGRGYWHTYAAKFANGLNKPAQTQIVLTGTFAKTLNPQGMASMRPSGGVIANPSARAGWNETEYSLLNLNRALSAGLYIGPDADGSVLRGFRVLPDGGGQYGLDLYNNTAATASSGWADEIDIGIVADSTANLYADLVQAVGHYRAAGLLVAAIDFAPRPISEDPEPPYNQVWKSCEFEGFKSVSVRGADTYRIIGVGADYVEVEYSPDHPFNPVVEPYVALSKNNFSHTPYQYGGTSVIGGTTLRLTGFVSNPSSSFVVGDTVVARPFGGGTSHVTFTDCLIGGMKHPSGLQCHDQALGADAMPNPGTAIEMNGARMVEVAFDGLTRIQSGEQVAVHLHECADVLLPGLIEFNTDINSNTRGMRMLMSPLYSSNTRVANPAGSTIRARFGNGLSNFLNNNGPSGALDLRPFVNIPSAAYALFSSDNGFFECDQGPIIPELGLYYSGGAVGVRAPKGGVAGIFGDTYPTPLEKLVYDATLDYLIHYEHFKPDTTNARDHGDATHVLRAVYTNSVRLFDGTTTVRSGSGSPEGAVFASIGSFYLDATNGVPYHKRSGSGTTGWLPMQVYRSGTATYDPPNLVDGDGASTTVTVTGAALGDVALASFSLSTQGITVTATVTAANTVTVRFQNETGGAIDLASGTLKAVVFQ